MNRLQCSASLTRRRFRGLWLAIGALRTVYLLLVLANLSVALSFASPGFVSLCCFQQQSGVRNRFSIRVRTIQHFHAALLFPLLLPGKGFRVGPCVHAAYTVESMLQS